MRQNKADGFTLIELMMAIAILAVIVAIAVPMYGNYVEKTRRSDAISTLTATAQLLERCFTRTNTYQNCVNPTTFASGEGFYQIDVTATATTYTLSAAPRGVQADDVCGTFTLDQLGNRTPVGTGNRCWGSN